MFIEPGKKIVFIGDSVTDAGRRDVAVPYGNGYVSMFRGFMLARYPDLNLSIVNRGVNGNTVRDLAARWEQDVIAEQPDYVSVSVGINDVWRQFHGDPSTAVFPDEYRNTLHHLLQRTRDALGARLILMTPYMIESNRNLPLRRQLDVYGEIVGALAQEFGARLVQVQAAFDTALRVTVPSFWSDDQFHPNGPGHAVIAQALLRALDYELA